MDERNVKVERLMKDLIKELDPNGDGSIKRKGSLIDELPKTVSIECPETEHYAKHTMNVLCNARGNESIWMELTPKNMEFLANALPHAPPPKKKARRANGATTHAETTPNVKETQLQGKRGTLLTLEYVDHDGKKVTKKKKVPQMTDLALMTQCVHTCAEELQKECDELQGDDLQNEEDG